MLINYSFYYLALPKEKLHHRRKRHLKNIQKTPKRKWNIRIFQQYMSIGAAVSC